jgi:peroxiredoxin
LRGIEKNIEQLKAQGIRPVAISVDSPETSRSLMQQQGYTFTFLSDPNVDMTWCTRAREKADTILRVRRSSCWIQRELCVGST